MQIADGSEITLMPYLKASAGCVLVLDPALLSPNLNYDFTNKFDDGTRYERGGYTYSRPYGWYRYALNVGGRYEDDVWLGEPGNRAGSTSGEWPVSYHGTHKENADSIAMRGYDLSRSKRKLFGRGIYTSPSIEVAALYSEKFGHQSKMYMMVFQNRVNPDGLKIIDKDEINRSDVTDEYWLQPKDYYVRPYGICIKEC